MSVTVQPIKVVAGLIFDAGRVLACQRHASGAFPLKWEFPGGKVKTGEAEIDALRRELQEELGIVVGEVRAVFQNEHVYPDGLEVSLRFFEVLSYEGVAQNLVFQSIRWVDLSKLGQLDFLAGDQPVIHHLVSDSSAAIGSK